MRRFFRIYPAFWVACAISVAIHQLANRPAAVDFWSLSLLPTLEFNNTLDIPYWTLIFEMAFYAVMSIALAFKLPDMALACAALIWILLVQICAPYFAADAALLKAPGFWILFSPYTQLFCAGLLLCLYRQKISTLGPAVLIGTCILTYAMPSIWPMGPAQRLLLYGFSFAALTAAGLHLSKVPYVFRRLGDWSYGLYLMHLPILAILATGGLLSNWDFWPTFYALLAAAFIGGNLFGLAESFLHRRLSKALSSRLSRSNVVEVN